VNALDSLSGVDAWVQREYFERADPERFHWITGCPGFAETEDELLAPLLRWIESPCLEVGCGEGNNLVRLIDRARCVGVDLFPRKLAFAAQQLPEAHLATADAAALPFAKASFQTVFVRDLLHHVPDPARVLAGVMRVLAPGGRLCLIEPNARNPVVRLQTHLVPAEAGARISSPDYVAGLLRELPLRDVEVSTRQPLPLRRALLHYKFGFPSLGRYRSSRRALASLEGALGRLVPASRWSYVVATARRSTDQGPEAGPKR
jgi:ubiquinone/menaquinone biosynthesis C-methylase UbiE